jgi:hypothetical protein
LKCTRNLNGATTSIWVTLFSIETWYPFERLTLPAAKPVVHQLRPMQVRPVLDEALGGFRKPTFEDFSGANIYRGLELAIDGVEVRWMMIVHKHPDVDAVEE